MRRNSLYGLSALFAVATLGAQGGPTRPTSSHTAKPPIRAIPASRDELFGWFDTLGYDVVRTGQFVRVSTWFHWGNRAQAGEQIYGFLVSGGRARFTVLTTDLDYVGLPLAPRNETGAYQPADFAQWVATQRASGRRDPFRDDVEGPLTTRGVLFAISRACDARALKAESAEFLRRARSEHSKYRQEKPDFRAQLSDDLATHAVWEAISQFGDPNVSRKDLIAKLERTTRAFPAGPRNDVAKETLAKLRTMVAEEEAHRVPSGPLEQLPTERQVAELIFQLRDQPGFQNSVPGYPDIFDTPPASPANRLVKIGFAAVPQLLDLLRDDRYTRAMQMIRFTGYSRPILFKDASLEILSKIANRSLAPERGAKSPEEWDAKIEKTARAWWREVQEKGEERTLVEGAERGDYEGAQQAKALATKYPSSAVAPIRIGLSHATDATVREELIDALMPIRSREVSALAEHHMVAGKTLRERMAGARIACTSDPAAVTSAMISEWRRLHANDEVGDNLVEFLAGSGRAEAVKALASKLSSQDTGTRCEVVQAFFDEIPPKVPWGYPEQGLRPKSEKEKDAYRTAVEDLLAGELKDTADAGGARLNYGGKWFDGPRVCDLAASELAILWPARYGYRVTSSLFARDAMRIKSLNAWRRLHNLPSLPLPSEPAVKTPTRRERTLLAQAISGPATSRQRAAGELLPHADSVLPFVLQQMARRNASKLDRAAMQALAATLACAARKVSVHGRGGGLVGAVNALKGRALTTQRIQDLVRRIQGSWPAGARTVEFKAGRRGDGRGFEVTVDLSDRVDEENPTAWDFSESVIVNGEQLGGSSGSSSGGPPMSRDTLDEFASTVHKALSSDALTAVSIQFTLSRPK